MTSDESGDARARTGVAVFAPGPIVTVTVEEDAEHEPDVHFHAGGQGFWVARMAASLGVPVTLCAPFGGETGNVLRPLIESEAVELKAVPVARANGAYVHDRRSGEREPVAEIPSPVLSRHDEDDLYGAMLTTGLALGVAVLTGTIEDVVPVSMYGRLALDFGLNDVLVVADLSGEPLRSLGEGVTFLKTSHEDLERDGHVADTEPGSLIRAMREFRERGSANVIVSRAEEPSLALLDDELFEVHPPRFEPLDHRGAGDSMAAALAAGLVYGLEPSECVRLAAAAGALNVTRHGLGTGRREQIEQLASEVELRPLKGV